MDHTTMSMPMDMAMAPVADAAAAATTMGSHSEAAAASSMGSSSAMMAMTFFQARGTPLFTTGWAPRTGAAYAATCLFLIALGVVLRCLLALRPLLEDLVWRAPPPTPPSAHHPMATEEADDYEYDEDDEAEEQKHPVDCEILVPSPGGKPDSHRPGARARHRLHRAAGRHPPSPARALWTEIRRRGRASRVGVSAGRAAFELLLAMVGYLLMLAVMTMNLGYFASVLAGVFLGTFVLGDLATSSSQYQDHQC